jgi:hypothetical protein
VATPITAAGQRRSLSLLRLVILITALPQVNGGV